MKNTTYKIIKTIENRYKMMNNEISSNINMI